MAYCRWSSDDYQCDVYAYEAIDGLFYVHVAGVRIKFKKPLPDFVPLGDVPAWVQRHKIILGMLDDAEREPIGLSRDSQHYAFRTAQQAADFLNDLRNEGYNVPDYAINALMAEADNTND